MHTLTFLLFLLLHHSPSLSVDVSETCEQIETYLPQHIVSRVFQNPIIRHVDATAGSDTPQCLNSTSEQPCATLQYALYGGENSTAVQNVSLQVGAGEYRLVGSLAIVDSQWVSIIGSGGNKTILTCGAFGSSDSPCSYMNFEIRKSNYVYISGLTFSKCGPITSNVYVAESDYIYFKDCIFRDNLSPPMLLYNVPAIVLEGIHFCNNKPQYLQPNISRDFCYFSGRSEVFFLDNRTTSGAISLYNKDISPTILISDCLFQNNSARPDGDLSLPRASDGYGHGGAVTLRFFNCSNGNICVKDSTFVGNSAQAHAGALSIGSGLAIENRVLIMNCTFRVNYCEVNKCTAGALGLDFYSKTYHNEILVSQCNFTGNEAKSGGAISLLTLVSSDGNSDSLTLDRCHFEANKAFYEGTAVGVFAHVHADQIGFPLQISNCSFVNNSATQGSADTTAITLYQVLATFKGKNAFYANDGGGISLLGSRMDVQGFIVFENNTAVFGGCIAMSGRSLVLMYSGSRIVFLNTVVSEEGGGMYVEYTANDFVLNVLNRGCFIQYYSESVDIPPNLWDTVIEFTNNVAKDAGAAIYSNDMSRCKWLGVEGAQFTEDFFIFQTPANYTSPFNISDNRLLLNSFGGENRNPDLGTGAAKFSARPDFNTTTSYVSFGERVSFSLSSSDQLDNFREAVWSVNAPLEQQPLGSLSSNNSVFIYDVPSQSQLEGVGISVVNQTANITTEFTLLGSQVSPSSISMYVNACHPGYSFDDTSQKCQCNEYIPEIVRCDSLGRYFYVRDGYWVGKRDDNTPYFSTAIPGFLECTREGTLPGCLFKFDDPDEQCAHGREGELCGDCREGYGVTFDLRFCQSNCGAGGITLFIVICLAVIILALLALYFDFPIPNELKGVIFFAQVIGVIYRNTPYLLRNTGAGYRFFDFLINMLGFAMPFPVCLYENVQALGVAFLGFFPPVFATVTAIMYILCANRVRFLSERKEYGFHGFYFLSLFTYKYLVDTSFIFVSCASLDSQTVFIYEGSFQCFEFPFVIPLVLGMLVLSGLGIILPAYILYIIYQPKKAIQASDALTHGLKDRRRYRWYGVWDIWRRLLFVAANLFISLATSSGVLFIQCVLVLVCLAVLCIVKPYKKHYINVLEAWILLCLLGATLSILDENDIYIGDKTGICFIAGPLLYGAFFIVFRISRKLWRKADEKWEVNTKCYQKIKPYSDYLAKHIPLDMAKKMMGKEDMDSAETSTQGEQSLQSNAEQTNDLETGTELREPLLEDNL